MGPPASRRPCTATSRAASASSHVQTPRIESRAPACAFLRALPPRIMRALCQAILAPTTEASLANYVPPTRM
eukprot:1575177-Alexandrium_andersonii.AAC.1